MKRIIITSKMLSRLNEETTTLQFTSNNNDPSNVLSNTDNQSKIQQAHTTFGGNVTAEITPEDGPGDTTITVPNSKGGTNGAQEAIRDNSSEAQKALSNGMNVGVDVSEGIKIFSKKSVEEARLAKIKKEGHVMTKKEMTESFINKK